MDKIKITKLDNGDVYLITTVDEKGIVGYSSFIHGEHLRFIKEEVIDDIRKRWGRYYGDDRITNAGYLIFCKEIDESEKRHLSTSQKKRRN